MKGETPSPMEIEESAVFQIANSASKQIPQETVRNSTTIPATIANKLSVDLQPEYNRIIQTIQRDINILNDSTQQRQAKVRALNKIQQELFESSIDSAILEDILKNILVILLKGFSDSIEKVRELSVGIVSKFCEAISKELLTSTMQTITPTLISRLAQPTITEPSEEIRLQIIQMMNEVSDILENDLCHFTDDFIKILVRSLDDSFPDVKKESFKLVITLGKYAPSQVSYHGGVITKALLPSLYHRHSSVRVAAIQALASSIYLNISTLDDTLDTLHALCIDKAPLVRETLYITVGYWMRELPDRNSVAYKLLPILYAGMNDDIQKLRDLAAEEVQSAGRVWVEDWEDRVKDEIDYVGDDEHNIGSRYLARDNTLKIVEKCVVGISSWTADLRHHWLKILSTFITLTRENITGYVAQILPAICRIIVGDETEVVDGALNVARLIGIHVSPKIHLTVSLSNLSSSSSSVVNTTSSFQIGWLRTIAALLNGSPSKKCEESEHDGEYISDSRLQTVVDVISDIECAGNENFVVVGYVEKVVEELLSKMKPVAEMERDEEKVAFTLRYDVFLVLMRLLSFEGSEKLDGFKEFINRVNQCLEILSVKSSHSHTVFQLFLPKYLQFAQSSQKTWTKDFPEIKVFATLIRKSEKAIGEYVDVFVYVIEDLCNIDRDFEIRKRALSLLYDVLISATSDSIKSSLGPHSETLLSQILIPNLIWKAGRKATLIRQVAIRILLELLYDQPHIIPPTLSANSWTNYVNIQIPEPPIRIGVLDPEVIKPHLWSIPATSNPKKASLISVLSTCIEDDEAEIRRATVCIWHRLFQFSEFVPVQEPKFQAVVDLPAIKQIYPDLLKRLDDAQDDIRILVSQFTLSAMFRAVKNLGDSRTIWAGKKASAGVFLDEKYFEIQMDDVHWEAIMKVLGVHIDDTNSVVQEAVVCALKEMINVGENTKSVVKDYLNGARARYRTKVYVDQILEFLA
ncbi:HEAT repeat-containing protein 2 [Nowakowskiella sp. JEL0407]|nr:HEAT repeat-containing protein 2 [Nowakowskiella sp. JEL0407]